jgi:hypothetical protein
VREGEAGKKAKTTQHAGGKSVREKSKATRTSKNLFEKCTHQEYFVDVVKDRRMSKNGVEFLIGWLTFLISNMIRGSLSLIYQVDRLFSSVLRDSSAVWGS